MGTNFQTKIIMMQNTDFQKEILDFFELYLSENYSEALHEALYYLCVDGEPAEYKKPIYDALYVIRHDMNEIVNKYLKSENQLINS